MKLSDKELIATQGILVLALEDVCQIPRACFDHICRRRPVLGIGEVWIFLKLHTEVDLCAVCKNKEVALSALFMLRLTGAGA